MLLVILTLGSCSDKKDGALTVFYSITQSQDMADLADLSITYKDGKGNNVTEVIPGTTWEKKIVIGSFPAEVGLVDYSLIPKTGKKLKKETLAPNVEFSLFAREDGFNMTRYLVDIPRLPQSKVADFIELANDHEQLNMLKTITKVDNAFHFMESDSTKTVPNSKQL